jgi:hypothetical protein
MTAHYARITDQTVRRRWEQGEFNRSLQHRVGGASVAVRRRLRRGSSS